VAVALLLAVVVAGAASPLIFLLVLLGYKLSVATGIAATGSSAIMAMVGIFRRIRRRRP
jgi:hypothetical protein